MRRLAAAAICIWILALAVADLRGQGVPPCPEGPTTGGYGGPTAQPPGGPYVVPPTEKPKLEWVQTGGPRRGTTTVTGEPAGGWSTGILLRGPGVGAPEITWANNIPQPPIEPIPPILDPRGGKDQPDPEPEDPELPYLTTTTAGSGGCECTCGAPAACDLNTEPPRLGLPVPPAFAFRQPSTTPDHSSVLVRDGEGKFIWQTHTGAGQTANTQYVRYVDGTVVEMERVPTSGTTVHWRPTAAFDAYDNRTNYRYDNDGRLIRIERPSGIDEVYDHSPSWIGTAEYSTGDYAGIEIRYVPRESPANEFVSKRKYLLFKKRRHANGNPVVGSRPFAGDLLYRVYYQQCQTVPDLPGPSGQRLNVLVDESAAATGFQVLEYAYVPGTGLLESVTQFVSSGLFGATISQPVVTVRYEYAVHGVQARVTQETLASGIVYNYSYTLRPDNLVSTQTRTSPTFPGEVVVTTLDERQRVLSRRIWPRTNLGDRSQDPDKGSTSDPAFQEVVYEYASVACTCSGKPTSITHWPSGRRTEYVYDTLTGLVTQEKVINPATGVGQAVTTTTWEPAVAGDIYGQYRVKSVQTPDGKVWEYSYVVEPRQNPAYGVKSQVVKLDYPKVTGSAPPGSPDLAATWFYSVAHPVLDTSGRQAALAGHLVDAIDADGIKTHHTYDTFGRLSSVIVNPGGGADEVTTTTVFDRWGDLVSVTERVGSATPLTTTFEYDGRGRLTRSTKTVGGVPHESKFFYDRWSNLVVELSSNKNAAGGAPDDFHPSQPRADVARPWIRNEFRYDGHQLVMTLLDRRSLDRNDTGAVADSLDARFVRTDYHWTPDDWLLEVVTPNGASRKFQYDGFGSLYKEWTETAGQSVLHAKYFVNDALEVVRTVDALGHAIVVTRNAAGLVDTVTEPPTTTMPAGFAWSAPAHARTSVTRDIMGRTTAVEVFDAVTNSRLLRQETTYDEIGRDYLSSVYEGASTTASQTYQSVWSGLSKVVKSTGPAGRFVEREYDAVGRIKLVKDSRDATNPNRVEYHYEPKSAWLRQVVTRNQDEAAASPGPVDRITEYVRDNLGRVLEMRVGPSGSPLVHHFSYYASGATESYTDPSGKVERYLPDALGRLRERYLPGAQPIWNGAVHTDWTGQADRSELLQIDGLGNATRTVFDFAGRPQVVMEPGSSVEPTAASPHQPFARFLTYDAASRLHRVHAGNGVDLAFEHDAMGRLLRRSRVMTALDAMVSNLWGRDELRRNALGQVVETRSFTGLGPAGFGDEYAREQFDRDPLGRTLREEYAYAGGIGGPRVLSTFAGGDPFRATLTIQNGAAVDDLQARYTPDAVGRVSSIDWRVQAADPWSALASYAHEGAAIRRRSTTQALGLGGVGTPFTFATTYGYDAYGRMATIDHGFDPAASVGFVYDAASNLTKELYHKQVGNRVGDRFGYDEHHRLRDAWLGSDAAHMAAPSGSDPVGTFVQKLTYGLDAANNRSTVAAQAGPSGSTSTSTYTRQAGSNRYQSVAGVAMAYDDRGNTHFDGRFFYVYDGLNRLTEVYALGTEDSAATGAASGGGAAGASTSASSSSMTFTVSDVSALEHARGQILNRLYPDAYDLLDRATCPVLKPKCKQGLSPLVVTASPAASPSTGGASSTSATSSGGTNETVTLELKALYLYDPMNRRVVRWVLGEATYYYAYDGWQEVQEYAPGAAVEMTQFVWGEQLDELVAFRTSPGVGVWSNYYVAEGGAHCPSRVLNEAGGVVEVQEYDPYGATTYYSGGVGYGRSQVGNPFGWKAVRVDAETGLLYMRNRYYHVGWGRFLTQDPLGVGGDPVTRFNSYNYGSGSPLIELDPHGLQVRVTDGKVESIGPYDGATVKMVWDHRSGQFVEHGRFGMLTADGVIPLGRTAGNFNDGWAMLNMAYDRANPRASGPVDLSGLPLRSFDANANEWSPLQPEDVAWLSENLSQWRQATVGTIEGMAFQSAFLSAGVAMQWMQVLRQMPAPSSRPCPPSAAAQGASSRILGNSAKQLQKKFKHAGDFGVPGGYSRASAAAFSRALNQHINSPAVRAISGTYRGNPVTHYVNPGTGLNVIADQAGNFVSGWRLSGAQLQNVLSRGSL
jgi:RHS repeat-associated protein